MVRRKPFYGAAQAEVRRKLTAFRSELDRGLPVPDDRITVAQLLDDWLQNEVRPRRRPATYTSYASHVRNHLIPGLGKVRVARLSPAQVEHLLNKKIEEGLSARTVDYIRAILRRALQRAERRGMVGRNVAKLVESPRQERYRVYVPPPDEMNRIMEALRSDRLWALYFVALTLGLRSGELRGLRWANVDLDLVGSLRVEESMQRVNGSLEFAPLKTDQSRRSLPIPTVTRDALSEHRVRQERERVFAGRRWVGKDLVFTTTIGTPLDASTVVHRFQRSLADHGFSPMRLHDLRHACASYLVSRGVELRMVMEILGHSQIGLTANLYSHILPGASIEALANMDSLFGGAVTGQLT